MEQAYLDLKGFWLSCWTEKEHNILPSPRKQTTGHGIDKIPSIGKKELLLSKSRNKKWGPLYLTVFALKLQKVGTTCIPCDFWVRIGATAKTACMWKLEQKHWKIRFYGIYIEKKQLGSENDVIKMKLEYHLKWFSTIHCRRPWWESWTQQHPFRLRYAHETLRLILARKTAIENSINVALWSMSFK